MFLVNHANAWRMVAMSDAPSIIVSRFCSGIGFWRAGHAHSADCIIRGLAYLYALWPSVWDIAVVSKMCPRANGRGTWRM